MTSGRPRLGDRLRQAWLARVGRAGSADVVHGAGDRLGGEGETRVTFAGQR